MSSLVVTYPGLPPASYSPNSRATHWQRTKDRDDVTSEMSWLVLEAGWKGNPIEKCRAKVTFYMDRRRRDADNLQARSKCFWDALQILGVLVDDDLEHLGWPQYGHEYGKPYRTVIEIEPLVGQSHGSKLRGNRGGKGK